MPKKRSNGLGFVLEEQQSEEVVPQKKKKKQRAEDGDSSSRIVTASGQKLDLKKSQKIKELRKKREEKITKSRKRELKQIVERKTKRQTASYTSFQFYPVYFQRAELIASLQKYQLESSVQTLLQPTVERKPRKGTEE